MLPHRPVCCYGWKWNKKEKGVTEWLHWPYRRQQGGGEGHCSSKRCEYEPVCLTFIYMQVPENKSHWIFTLKDHHPYLFTIIGPWTEYQAVPQQASLQINSTIIHSAVQSRPLISSIRPKINLWELKGFPWLKQDYYDNRCSHPGKIHSHIFSCRLL